MLAERAARSRGVRSDIRIPMDDRRKDISTRRYSRRGKRCQSRRFLRNETPERH